MSLLQICFLRAQKGNEVSHKVLCQAFFQESGGRRCETKFRRKFFVNFLLRKLKVAFFDPANLAEEDAEGPAQDSRQNKGDKNQPCPVKGRGRNGNQIGRAHV